MKWIHLVICLGCGLSTVLASPHKSSSMKVELVMSQPFAMIKSECKNDTNSTKCQGNGRYEGISVDLFELLEKRIHNFGFVFKESPRIGTRLPLGNWDGALGKLLSKEADMVIGPVVITQERSRAFQFTQPFLISGISVMIKKPVEQGDWNLPPISFLLAFSRTSWLLICLAYLAIGILYSFIKTYPKSLNVQGRKKRSSAEQLIFLGFLFFTLFIFEIYTANLVTIFQDHFSMNDGQIGGWDFPRTLTELLRRSPEIKYGIVKGGTTASFFKNNISPQVSEMWRRMNDQNTFVANYAEGIERVRNTQGHYVFILDDVANRYENTWRPCDTIVLGDLLHRFGYGIALPPSSNLTHGLNIALLEMQENGSLKKIEDKWLDRSEQSECTPRKDLTRKSPSNRSINVSAIAGVFYILTGILILAIIVAVVEHFIAKKRKTQETETLTS